MYLPKIAKIIDSLPKHIEKLITVSLCMINFQFNTVIIENLCNSAVVVAKNIENSENQ